MEQPIWIDLHNSPHVPFFEPIPDWQSNYDINTIPREIHPAVVRAASLTELAPWPQHPRGDEPETI
mgnify:FL=1